MKAIYGSIGIVGLAIGVLAFLAITPMMFLWSINSLAELGGATFYIEHTLWSYFVSIVFLVVMMASVSTDDW